MMCQREGHVTIDKMFKKNTHKLKQAKKNGMHSVPICTQASAVHVIQFVDELSETKMRKKQHLIKAKQLNT